MASSTDMQDPTPNPSTTDSSIDSSHEMFLYHSDNPNRSLASKVLDGENYGHWRRAVEVSFLAKNKLGLVKGTTTKPDKDSLLLSK